MHIVVLLYLFLVGLCVGSFLNVVIDRIPQGISILKGRSKCDSCGHVLSILDLVPLFSFAALFAKCRYCHVRLSLQYPLIEGATGILFVVTYVFSASPTSPLDVIKCLVLIALFSTFLALSIMDIKYGILSDKLVLAATLWSVILLLFSPATFLSHLFVGGICLGLLLLLFLVTKGNGIGLGDVKLSFVMGFFLGFPSVLIAFYMAFLTGAFIAIILVLAKKKKLVGGTIAFGPFLLLGTYISWYFGNSLWLYFLHLLGAL